MHSLSQVDPPVRLEAESVIACDLTEVSLQLLQQLLVANGLLAGNERVDAVELWHRDRD